MVTLDDLAQRRGEVASLLDPSPGAEIANAGGRLMANVGRTTTLLVVAGKRPLSQSVRRSVGVLKAEGLAADSTAITILTADQLRDCIAGAPAQGDAP